MEEILTLHCPQDIEFTEYLLQRLKTILADDKDTLIIRLLSPNERIRHLRIHSNGLAENIDPKKSANATLPARGCEDRPY
jgi:hypothetical protein